MQKTKLSYVSFVTLVSLQLCNLSIAHAEHWGNLSAGYATMKTTGTALSDDEANKSPGFNLSGYIGQDLTKDLSHALSVGGAKLSNKNAGNGLLDDSFNSAMSIGYSLHKNISDADLIAAGLAYSYLYEDETFNEGTRTERVAKSYLTTDFAYIKQISGLKLGLAAAYSKNQYAALDSDNSTPYYADNIKNIGIFSELAISNFVNLGVAHHRYSAVIKRDGSNTEPDKTAQFSDFYLSYVQPSWTATVGYSVKNFNDKSDDEKLSVKGFFARVDIPFGKNSSALTDYYLKNKPQTSHFIGITSGQLE